jgi:hypothetical protein
MSEVRQKLIVGIFSSVFVDKSKYCQNQSFQPFFCLIEGSPLPDRPVQRMTDLDTKPELEFLKTLWGLGTE